MQDIKDGVSGADRRVGVMRGLAPKGILPAGGPVMARRR